MGFRVTALKGARWLLWLFMALIMVRGIASIVLPAPKTEAPVAVAAAPAPPAYDAAPGAFAALFAKEYLTWQAGSEADHAARLQGLLASGLDSQAGWAPGPRPQDQTADATWPFSVEKLGDSRWLVTVAARVTTTQTATQSATQTTAQTTPQTATQTATQSVTRSRTLYLAVPVQGGGKEGYAVSDYPAVVPGPETAKAGDELPGDQFSDSDGQINLLLTGFFKAYAAGGTADVAYFLEPGARVRGLEGALVFKGVSDLKLRRNGQENWVSVLVSMDDPVSGIGTRQRFTLQIEQKDGRWYIKQILQKGV